MYKRQIEDLRGACKDVLTDEDDTTLLRFVLEHPEDAAAAASSFREVVAWRQGEGKAMIESAKKAVDAALKDGAWNNEAVFGAAPNSAKVSGYLTPSNIVVVSTKEGDLVSCIRAAAIDSPKMMDAVTVEELVDFFLYSREVNFVVADMRTRKSGRLTRLVAANDLTGVSSFPDSRFQTALTESSKKAAKLYPGFTGPTVLLNLPWLARALVSLLTPLFPGAVREKIKFARTPMDYMKNLKDITKEPTRSMFVDDLGAVLNS